MTSFDVVIPAAHAETTLERAARSVLVSALVDHLVIVVDGGKETFAVASRLAQQDERVVLARTGSAGPGAARNRGLAECSARWVAFLDADDEYAPDYLEAVAQLIDSAQVAPALVHTNIVRVLPGQSGGGQSTTGVNNHGEQEQFSEHRNHPLRFRFEHGSRITSLELEPHMVGTSVAAAVFNRAALAQTGVRFVETIPWSEDADFIVRYLLELYASKAVAPSIGFCAQALYRYHVGATDSTTVSAWSDPEKYTRPFEELYLRWVALAKERLGVLPRWLQNTVLYDLFWYVDADRQVFHPSQHLPVEVRAHCAQLIGEVAGYLDFEAVQEYALTPVGLERRMLLASQTRGAPSAPLNGQVISYAQKPWQPARKYTYFYGEQLPTEQFVVAGSPVAVVGERWVSHTLFDRQVVCERIVWIGEENPVAELGGVAVKVAPFAGYPKLPAPGSNSGAGATADLSGEKLVAVKPAPGMLVRARKKLWRLRQVAKGRLGRGEFSPPAKESKEQEAQIWFYMDRAHRAGDNAEALYRYAAVHAPQVEHVFALSKSSPDWQRLEGQGFNLLDTDSAEFAGRVRQAQNLLVSDISDRVLAPLLGQVPVEHRIVFLQHGITRKQMWRWMNPRRIDVLITSTADETAGIIGNGSHYTLSAPEVWQTGMPRLDALVRLRAKEQRRDTVLIAPTWNPQVRDSKDLACVQAWIDGWTAWLSEDQKLQEAGLRAVFFVHPNMEQVIMRTGAKFPCTAVYGSELAAELARSVATVTDRSSIADEGHYVGVPSFLVKSKGTTDLLAVKQGYNLPGFTFIESKSDLKESLEYKLSAHCNSAGSVSYDSHNGCKRIVDLLLKTV